MATMAVTGANGHLGANLVRELVARGQHVRVLVHAQDGALAGLPLERIRGDLLAAASLDVLCRGADAVFHLAALPSHTSAPRHDFQRINVAGTRAVVEACQRNAVPTLLHVSTLRALVDDGRPLSEHSELAIAREHGVFDQSKALAERCVLDAHSAALRTVVVSPGAILGPHDHAPSPLGRTLLALQRGKLPAIAAGGFAWTDVRDVVETALKAAQREHARGRYMIAGPHRSLRELLRRAAELIGVQSPTLELPLSVLRTLAPAVAGLARVTRTAPLWTDELVERMQTHRHVDVQRTARELGVCPRPIEETLSATYAWFRDASLAQRGL